MTDPPDRPVPVPPQPRPPTPAEALEAYREAAAAVEWIDLADEWDRHPAAEVLRHALDLAAERSTFTPLDVVAEGLGIELPAD